MITIYDFETIKNCFVACYKNKDSGEKKQFVIWKHYNQFEELIEYLKTIKGQIGYNCLNFDAQIQQELINKYNYLKQLNSEELVSYIYNYSQKVIEKSNNNEWSDYPEWKLSIKQLDIFLLNHWDNKSKSTSLKWLQFMIDWEDLREMNINHYDEIETEEQLQELIYYCWNDVDSTEKVYKITKGNTELSEYKGKDKVQFRKDIQNKFGKKNCINWNDVKIGDELNYLAYSKSTGETKAEIFDKKISKKQIKISECIPSYIVFKTKLLNSLLDKLNKTTISLLEPKLNETVTIGNTTHNIKLGGIHSEEKPRRVILNENQIMIDSDVGGQHPSAIAKRKIHPDHLDESWCIQIEKNILERDKLKPESKKNNKIAAWTEALKLCNNGGGYGKLGEITNWQNDFKAMYSVTIGNQLEILMLIEDLELNGINVISSNTDGIISILDKSKEAIYYKICKDWEVKVNAINYGKLEHTYYKELIQMSVNDYIAIKTNGDIKRKGDFMIDFELHKNKSRRIVPIALGEYYINKKSVEKTITSHSNIFDFCCAVRAKGTDSFYLFNTKTKEEIKQQKTVRYYISNSKDVLVKRMKPLENKTHSFQLDLFGGIDDGTRNHQVEAGYKVNVFNQFIKQDKYDINFNYYIFKTNEIINKIKPFQIDTKIEI